MILLLAPAEAASLLGGTTTTTAVGQTGLQLFEPRARRAPHGHHDGSAKQTWAGLKQQAGDAKWLVGEEPGMGSTAYAQLIRRSAGSSAGKVRIRRGEEDQGDPDDPHGFGG